MSLFLRSLLISLAGWSLAFPLALPSRAEGETIHFNRDIRPILSDNCFACHGPDEKQRKGKLRLDTREGLYAKRDGESIIAPGKSAESLLFQRLITQDEDDKMPPAKTGKELNSAQIERIRRWIDSGAAWEGHWAFIPPASPPLPKVRQTSWPKNEIDYFILSKLETLGYAPAPEADRARLLRRLSLDLTGLPPTPAELDKFLADKSPRAYETAVDRLLASPHYGERMALHWLDLARYADTHGYHLDAGREMWKWREWVIHAFNDNMPYDQFTVEQLAGDLLPNATVSQKLATGFNRNSMINFEGGAIPEEYLTQYIFDRVITTGTVYLGLAMACAQCHDHKYDPITQKDFYKFYAYFNAVPEKGLDGGNGNAAPLITLPTPAQSERLRELESALRHAEERLRQAIPEIDAAQAQWETSQIKRASAPWTPLEITAAKSEGGSTLTRLDDGSFLASGDNPSQDTFEIEAQVAGAKITGIRLEALTHPSLPAQGPGRAPNSNFVLDEFELEASSPTDPARKERVRFRSASADYEQANFPAKNAIDGDLKTGWAVDGNTRHANTTAWFFSEAPIGSDAGAKLRFLLRSGHSYSQHAIGRFRLSYTADPAAGTSEPVPPEIANILALPAAEKTAAHRQTLQKHYREKVSALHRERNEAVTAARKAVADLNKTIPSSMVMAQMEKPRDTFVLMRGQYNKPGEKVEPGVPDSLPPLPPGAPENRLGLAQWLVDPNHPLMARVTVNRFWALLMGAGLVKTANDFGSQAEWPTHPELLDWLATDFIRSGWNVKAFLKRIVTSAAYQQSAVVSPGLAQADPENRYYARGPRFRLSAEAIRDNALAISGLLVPALGGPSVYPYQPAGLWEELSSRQDSKNWTAQFFVQSKGQDLYRRSMYTFWKRTSPPPSLQAFDAPDRETCIVQRDRTSTPLQALVLLNDPTYVEAARKLAERMLIEASGTPADRVRFAFRLATARMPSPLEEQILIELFDRQKARFQANPEEAIKLLAVGDSPRNELLNASELAAWTSVASMILNLDETITKG